MARTDGKKAALAAGVCCALVGGATCGRKHRKGKCPKHGENIYQSFVGHHAKPVDGK